MQLDTRPTKIREGISSEEPKNRRALQTGRWMSWLVMKKQYCRGWAEEKGKRGGEGTLWAIYECSKCNLKWFTFSSCGRRNAEGAANATSSCQLITIDSRLPPCPPLSLFPSYVHFCVFSLSNRELIKWRQWKIYDSFDGRWREREGERGQQSRGELLW